MQFTRMKPTAIWQFLHLSLIFYQCIFCLSCVIINALPVQSSTKLNSPQAVLNPKYIQAMDCNCLSLSQLFHLTDDNLRTNVCWRYLNKIQYHNTLIVLVSYFGFGIKKNSCLQNPSWIHLWFQVFKLCFKYQKCFSLYASSGLIINL